jgi:hypothetical protein
MTRNRNRNHNKCWNRNRPQIFRFHNPARKDSEFVEYRIPVFVELFVFVTAPRSIHHRGVETPQYVHNRGVATPR